jgi:hypothetical protein
VAATVAVGLVGTEIGLLSSVASPENLVMDQDPVKDARALVEERFPQARWAVLAGSVITAHRTAGSDLDIVVLLPTRVSIETLRQTDVQTCERAALMPYGAPWPLNCAFGYSTPDNGRRRWPS